MNFSGKRVLITGGSRGIGKACAQAFAARGAQVAINFRSDKEAAQETLDGLPGGGHMLIQADVAQPSSAQKMIEAVKTGSPFPFKGGGRSEEAGRTEFWQRQLEQSGIDVAGITHIPAPEGSVCQNCANPRPPAE